MSRAKYKQPEDITINLDTYSEYLDNHIMEIADDVNSNLVKHKDYIKDEIIEELQDYLIPVPIHYEWQYDGCPWDYSGELIEDGQISLDITVEEFLTDEYTGNKTPTFCSGHGFSYDTYSDKLEYRLREIADELMLSAIREHLDKHFNYILSDDEFDWLIEITDHFDDIYLETIAFTFEYDCYACEFVGIKDMLLSTIINL